MGKEVVGGFKVVLLQIGEFVQNLFLRHPRRQIGHQVIYREPETPNTRFSAHLAGCGRDASFRVHDAILAGAGGQRLFGVSPATGIPTSGIGSLKASVWATPVTAGPQAENLWFEAK